MAGVRLSSAQLLAGLQQLGPAVSPSKTTVAFLTFKAQVGPLSPQRSMAVPCVRMCAHVHVMCTVCLYVCSMLN
jgi:hypothetical protein